MTSTHRERLGKASGHARRLLAVLVGLLATLALIVSGAAPASAQNAVGPQPQNWILAVGPHQAAAQTIIGVRGPPQLRHASATGVAADTAATVAPSVADVTALVPKGETLGSWGNQIWGTGAEGAKSLIGTRGATELSRIPGLNVQSATTLRNFYQGAVDAGKGGATAPVRVQLLDDIIKTLGGG